MSFKNLAGSEESVTILINDQPCQAYTGDTVAVTLYGLGIRAWRRSRAGDARGLLCGMGICYDCLVTIDGEPNLRACQVEVQEGMRVETSTVVERTA